MKTLRQFKRLLLIPTLTIIVLFSGISCSSNPTTSSPMDDENVITMRGDRFSPETMTISRGKTVIWVNNDDDVHTATSDYGDGGWSTGNIASGASRSITFYNRGTYPYHCVYHASMGMRGTIIVQ